MDFKFKCLKFIYTFKGSFLIVIVSIDAHLGDPIFEIIFNNLYRKTMVSNKDIVLMPSINYIFDLLNESNLNSSQENYLNGLLVNLRVYGRGLPSGKVDELHNNIRQLIQSQIAFSKSVQKSREKLIQFVNEEDMSEHTPDWLISNLRMTGSGNALKIDLKNTQMSSALLQYCTNDKVPVYFTAELYDSHNSDIVGYR